MEEPGMKWTDSTSLTVALAFLTLTGVCVVAVLTDSGHVFLYLGGICFTIAGFSFGIWMGGRERRERERGSNRREP
jgi:hypothetical protein